MNSPKSTKSEGSQKVVSHPLHANPSKNINPRTVNHRSVPSVDLYHAPDSPMETSEAAAALRANAAVKISKLGKVRTIYRDVAAQGCLKLITVLSLLLIFY